MMADQAESLRQLVRARREWSTLTQGGSPEAVCPRPTAAAGQWWHARPRNRQWRTPGEALLATLTALWTCDPTKR
jgi:hypothetical protein